MDGKTGAPADAAARSRKLLAFSLAEGRRITTIAPPRVTGMRGQPSQSTSHPIMKFVKVAVLAALAAGSVFAVSCCPNAAPAKSTYVAPTTPSK